MSDGTAGDEAGIENKTSGSESFCNEGLETCWQTKKPTLPGWYWFENEYYGPAPVKVEWTGFVKHPDARQLEITIACGEDSDQPLGEVESLSREGRWRAFNFVPEGV